MENVQTLELINADAFLENWQGNRRLTKRVIEAFPEKELFEFSVGGMRPFADLVKELLAIAVPGLKELVTGQHGALEERADELDNKAKLLQAWDEATPQIDIYFKQISAERFQEVHKLFGQYESKIIESVIYFVENEIHHRGQGFVYLRALGIEPPFFWER